jgi:hypothetical protein
MIKITTSFLFETDCSLPNKSQKQKEYRDYRKYIYERIKDLVGFR